MAYKYGYEGPPFNFLGHHSETQQQKFKSWTDERTGNFPNIQQFYQIRAAQLRKTSGVLEQFYKAVNDDQLTPTFDKAVWQPGKDGWFAYSYRDDHLPMVTMSKIKAHFREQLHRQDEAVFQMNHIRNLIEKTEDKAQKANEATGDLQKLFTQINGYFNKPEYQAVLVKDQTDLYQGQPRFRVHQLDEPTQWEKEQNQRTSASSGATLTGTK